MIRWHWGLDINMRRKRSLKREQRASDLFNFLCLQLQTQLGPVNNRTSCSMIMSGASSFVSGILLVLKTITSINIDLQFLHFGRSNLWMLSIHSMRSAKSILRQLHTLDESSINHPFQSLGSACSLSAFLGVFFFQYGSLFTRTFFHVILLIIFLCLSRLLNFILISLFMRISSSPSHQPRVIVELTRREQQIQAEYQLGSGPEDTSWKEGRLCIIKNYVRVGCEHSVYPLFLHCSVFPFAPHIYLGHFQ